MRGFRQFYSKRRMLVWAIALTLVLFIVSRIVPHFALNIATLTGVIAVLGLIGVEVGSHVLRRRRQSGFDDRMAAKEGIDDRKKEWEQWTKELSEQGIDRYRLPFYLLVGEPQSGKSQLLHNSDLHFPFGQSRLSGIGGTRGCDWWFTDEAVVLDMAGRLFTHEGGKADADEWEAFLEMVAEYRPLQPLNGVMLVIPCDSLLQDSEEVIARKAAKIQEALLTLTKKLQARFPVYISLTKADRILGFAETMHRLDSHRRKEMLGWSRSAENYDKPFSPEEFRDAYAELVRSGRMLRSEVLSSVRVLDALPEVDRLMAFPEELKSLYGPLKGYLLRIFGESEVTERLFLRGFYITSSLQKGAPVAKACAGLLGGDEEKLRALEGVFKRSKAFFIHDLVQKRIFEERGLVRPTKRRIQQAKRRAYVTYGTAAALVLGGLAYGVSFMRNNNTKEYGEASLAGETLANAFVNRDNLREPPTPGEVGAELRKVRAAWKTEGGIADRIADAKDSYEALYAAGFDSVATPAIHRAVVEGFAKRLEERPQGELTFDAFCRDMSTLAALHEPGGFALDDEDFVKSLGELVGEEFGGLEELCNWRREAKGDSKPVIQPVHPVHLAELAKLLDQELAEFLRTGVPDPLDTKDYFPGELDRLVQLQALVNGVEETQKAVRETRADLLNPDRFAGVHEQAQELLEGERQAKKALEALTAALEFEIPGLNGKPFEEELAGVNQYVDLLSEVIRTVEPNLEPASSLESVKLNKFYETLDQAPYVAATESRGKIRKVSQGQRYMGRMALRKLFGSGLVSQVKAATAGSPMGAGEIQAPGSLGTKNWSFRPRESATLDELCPAELLAVCEATFLPADSPLDGFPQALKRALGKHSIDSQEGIVLAKKAELIHARLAEEDCCEALKMNRPWLVSLDDQVNVLEREYPGTFERWGREVQGYLDAYDEREWGNWEIEIAYDLENCPQLNVAQVKEKCVSRWSSKPEEVRAKLYKHLGEVHGELESWLSTKRLRTVISETRDHLSRSRDIDGLFNQRPLEDAVIGFVGGTIATLAVDKLEKEEALDDSEESLSNLLELVRNEPDTVDDIFGRRAQGLLDGLGSRWNGESADVILKEWRELDETAGSFESIVSPRRIQAFGRALEKEADEALVDQLGQSGSSADEVFDYRAGDIEEDVRDTYELETILQDVYERLSEVDSRRAEVQASVSLGGLPDGGFPETRRWLGKNQVLMERPPNVDRVLSALGPVRDDLGRRPSLLLEAAEVIRVPRDKKQTREGRYYRDLLSDTRKLLVAQAAQRFEKAFEEDLIEGGALRHLLKLHGGGDIGLEPSQATRVVTLAGPDGDWQALRSKTFGDLDEDSRVVEEMLEKTSENVRAWDRFLFELREYLYEAGEPVASRPFTIGAPRRSGEGESVWDSSKFWVHPGSEGTPFTPITTDTPDVDFKWNFDDDEALLELDWKRELTGPTDGNQLEVQSSLAPLLLVWAHGEPKGSGSAYKWTVTLPQGDGPVRRFTVQFKVEDVPVLPEG